LRQAIEIKEDALSLLSYIFIHQQTLEDGVCLIVNAKPCAKLWTLGEGIVILVI
jgi:hypothetical protein